MIDCYTELICEDSHRLFSDKLFGDKLLESAGQFLGSFVLSISGFSFLDCTNTLNSDKQVRRSIIVGQPQIIQR